MGFHSNLTWSQGLATVQDDYAAEWVLLNCTCNGQCPMDIVHFHVIGKNCTGEHSNLLLQWKCWSELAYSLLNSWRVMWRCCYCRVLRFLRTQTHSFPDPESEGGERGNLEIKWWRNRGPVLSSSSSSYVRLRALAAWEMGENHVRLECRSRGWQSRRKLGCWPAAQTAVSSSQPGSGRFGLSTARKCENLNQ